MEILPAPRYESVLYTASKITCYSLWRIRLFSVLLLCSVGPKLHQLATLLLLPAVFFYSSENKSLFVINA